MKKYWILIVISVVMIASIGTFYIQSVFAANNKPAFTIEKVNGDEKEIASLLMTGFYYNELDFLGEELEISLEGTKYLEDSSFFERIEGIYGSHQIKQLQKDHRNFMRGKYYGINSYFENEGFLAYADVSYNNPYTVSSEFQFSIAVLDKQTNKTTSFDHLVPNGGDFWYLDVMKVQMVDDQLKVLTRNNLREDDDDEEIHLYTFDIAKEALVNDEVILSLKDIGYGYINIMMLDVDDPKIESEYIAFIKQTITNTEVEREDYFETVEEVSKEELIAYDLPSNTSKVISLDSLAEHGYPEYLDEQNVYFTDIYEDGVLKVAVYDIESEQIIDSFDVELPNSTGEVGENIRFNDGKLYIVDSYTDFETSAFVTVVHLENGEILFEGEITPKDQKGTVDKVRLDIYGILFE